MGYKSDAELNFPDALGKKLLINPFESVAAATDNRGSSLMAASTDFLAAAGRAWQSLEPVSADQPSLAWDYATQTLTITGSAFTLEAAWVDPSTGSPGSTRIVINEGAHVLGGGGNNVWVRLTPGSDVVVTADLASISDSPNNDGRIILSNSLAASQSAIFNAGDPNQPASYTSAEQASQYVPLFKIAGTSLSVVGGRWTIRDGMTWKLLDRDTQYVQVSDSTISVTATIGAMELQGQDNSQLLFSHNSSLFLGNSSNFNAGDDFRFTCGDNGSFEFGATMNFGLVTGLQFERGLEFGVAGLTIYENDASGTLSITANNDADLVLGTTQAGTFILNSGTSTFLFRGDATFSQNVTDAPVKIQSTVAYNTDLSHIGSPIQIRSEDGVLIHRKDGVDYKPFTDITLTVMDDGNDANIDYVGIRLHDVHATDLTLGRETCLIGSGEKQDGTLHDVGKISFLNPYATDTTDGEFRIEVNDGSDPLQLNPGFIIRSDEISILTGRPVLIDTNSILSTDDVDPVYYDLSGPNLDYGSPRTTLRESINSNSEMVALTIDNTDDDAGTSYLTGYRKTGLALRAFHGTEMFTQLLIRAENANASNDRDTAGVVSVWDNPNDVLKDIVILTASDIIVPSTVTLKTDFLESTTGGAITVSSDLSGDTLTANTVDVSGHVYAYNTPRAMAIINIFTNAGGVAPTITIWNDGSGDFENNVDAVGYNQLGSQDINVTFSFNADASGVTGVSNQLRQFAQAWIIFKTDTDEYSVEIYNHQRVNGIVDPRYRMDFLLRHTMSNNVTNLTTDVNLTFRIVVFGYDPTWY